MRLLHPLRQTRHTTYAQPRLMIQILLRVKRAAQLQLVQWLRSKGGRVITHNPQISFCVTIEKLRVLILVWTALNPKTLVTVPLILGFGKQERQRVTTNDSGKLNRGGTAAIESITQIPSPEWNLNQRRYLNACLTALAHQPKRWYAYQIGVRAALSHFWLSGG